MKSVTLALIASAASSSAALYPSFPLYNSAEPGLIMPAIGLGTGGYNGKNGSVPQQYPECWSQYAGCGPAVTAAVRQWIQLSPKPVRLDLANSYANPDAVAAAVAGVPREDLFILSKVGPGFPLGYNDTLQQIQQILTTLNSSYVDLLLVHWPYDGASSRNDSSDPACNRSATTFNGRTCRLNTWTAMLQIFNAGQARAIGVSNYNQTHLGEIIAAGLPLPAVNQCPFHLYRSSSQQALRDFCAANNILFHGYSPLGVPDWWSYPSGTGMYASQLQDSRVTAIAAAHGATPAQVLIAWQYALGIPVNPRTMNATHMAENLAAFSVALTPTEIATLSSAPQDTCALDPSFYELWCNPA